LMLYQNIICPLVLSVDQVSKINISWPFNKLCLLIISWYRGHCGYLYWWFMGSVLPTISVYAGDFRGSIRRLFRLRWRNYPAWYTWRWRGYSAVFESCFISVRRFHSRTDIGFVCRRFQHNQQVVDFSAFLFSF
jgi:hypothetical protein